jgi:small subunit ribosomal protein S6
MYFSKYTIGRGTFVNNYELTVIMRTRDIEALKERLKAILSKHEVVVVKDESWGQKRLAYEIDGEREGYYFIATIQAKPESVAKLNADFKLNTDILRYFFIKMKKVSAA